MPPLVLVDGLWDTPRVFNRLQQQLGGQRQPLLIPHLPHRLGAVGLVELAERLDAEIQAAFGSDEPIDLLGGHRRSRRLHCVGSPHAAPGPPSPFLLN